jgi:hypothetical protein
MINIGWPQLPGPSWEEGDREQLFPSGTAILIPEN